MSPLPSLNQEPIQGVELFAAIGPQFNFEYRDDEPYTPALSSSLVKGTVTGVPMHGQGFWLGFVGEWVNSKDFLNSAPINDWGDSTGFTADPSTTPGGGYMHVYQRPGLYFACSRRTDGGPVLAGRWIRVIYQSRPVSGTISAPAFSYPIEIAGTAEASTDATFSLRLTMKLDSYDYQGIDQGAIYDRTMIGIFARRKDRDEPVKLIAGGFATIRNLEIDAPGDTVEFTIYGPGYWLLQAYMREQQYLDPGIISLMQGMSAQVQVNGGDPLTQDVLGLGYVANHWLKCAPTIVAMHVLQHVRVYQSVKNVPTQHLNPLMANPGGSAFYGTLGQFMDIVVDDPNFDETVGQYEAGFQSFSVADGQVLSNIRQLLENEGWRYYDSYDLTQRFERKPYYRYTFIPAATSYNSHSPVAVPPYTNTNYADWVTYYSQFDLGIDGYGKHLISPACQRPDTLLAPNPAPNAAWKAYWNIIHIPSTGTYAGGKRIFPPGYTYDYRHPEPKLVITDMRVLPGKPKVMAATERPVRQIIIEKPPLAVLSDMQQAMPISSQPSSLPSGTTSYSLPADAPPLNPRDPYGNSQAMTTYNAGYDPTATSSDGIPLPPGTKAQASVLQYSTAQGNVGGLNFTQDPVAQFALDQTKFYDYYPLTPRSYGKTVGPLRNVYTEDGATYAKGRDKEERAIYSLELPLGEVFNLGLGDVIQVYLRQDVLGIDWSAGKLFEVVVMSAELTPCSYFLTVQCMEIDPDE